MLTKFLILAMEDPAHAGEAAEHAAPMDANLMPAITALVVFAIAFGILATVVWPKITKALDDRDNKIRDEIESAEEAREQAKAALNKYEAELANARGEATAMIQQARAEAKATANELRARNEEELAELRTRATRDIESAKESAISEIHAEAATLATAIASRILQREISVEDQQRLVNESLQQLSTVDRA